MFQQKSGSWNFGKTHGDTQLGVATCLASVAADVDWYSDSGSDAEIRKIMLNVSMISRQAAEVSRQGASSCRAANHPLPVAYGGPSLG